MENLYRVLEPEVAGGFGPETILDRSTNPPTPLKLHYEFLGWLGDDLLETTPCFIVTLALKTALMQFNGTGYSFDDVVVTKSDFFQETHPEAILPAFAWLRVHGSAGYNDAGLDTKTRLVVSDELLNVLKQYKISNCTIRRKPYMRRSLRDE